jgi:hypothetical protein
MKVNLNKKSVKQAGGGMMPSMMQPQQQQQVDPAIQQISEFFTSSIGEGKKPEEVVISLMQQEVDQNTIAQALMSMGYVEQELTILFKNVEELSQPKAPSNQQINNNPQQLARDQSIQENQPAMMNVDPIELAKEGDEISYSTATNNPNIKQGNEGMITPSPLFVNPTAFMTGDNFSLGKAANTLAGGYNSLFSGKDSNNDGEKDGAFRDWKTKAVNNKIDKYANADYTVTMDVGDENIGNMNNWYNQWMKENPEENELGQIIEDMPTDITLPPITQAGNNMQDWMTEKGSALTGAAKETYESLRKKLGFKYGGDLPIAQNGEFDFEEEPFYYQYSDGTNPAEGQGNPIPFEQRPGNSEAEQTIALNDQMRMDEANAEYDLANPSANDLWSKIKMPEVDADFGGLGGFIDRTLDSNVANAYGATSNFLVEGAGVFNDFMKDKEIDAAKTDNYNTFALADNIYGTKTDPFNKRGTTDINSGLIGSEADRTTGLYMSKDGGETANVDSAMLAKLIAAGADIEML